MGTLPKNAVTPRQPPCSGRGSLGWALQGTKRRPPSPERRRLSALRGGGHGAFPIDVDHPGDVAGALGALLLGGGPLPALHLPHQHLLAGSAPLQPLQRGLQLGPVPPVRGVAPGRQAEEPSCGRGDG